MKTLMLSCIGILVAAAAHAQAPSSTSSTFLTAAELRRAIEGAPVQQGQPGLYATRLSTLSDPEVVGIRRTAPARAELHDRITDVWYVIDGTATLTTGGTIEDGVVTEPGEIRGSRITSGISRRVRTGDYAVIPAGIPHWISKVESTEFLYFVVKVRSTTNPGNVTAPPAPAALEANSNAAARWAWFSASSILNDWSVQKGRADVTIGGSSFKATLWDAADPAFARLSIAGTIRGNTVNIKVTLNHTDSDPFHATTKLERSCWEGGGRESLMLPSAFGVIGLVHELTETECRRGMR